MPRRPLGPTLRANPFPEVTDLFCRLPLPTLFYQLEAAHLGDLMRLCVRPRVRISLSPGFSRAVGSAPDTSKIKVLCQLCHPIAGQSDSRVTWCCQKEKRTLPGAPADVSGFACVATHYPRLGSGILTRFPFDRRGGRKRGTPDFRTEFPYLLGSTNPCPIAVHMEPCSTSVFKVLI